MKKIRKISRTAFSKSVGNLTLENDTTSRNPPTTSHWDVIREEFILPVTREGGNVDGVDNVSIVGRGEELDVVGMARADDLLVDRVSTSSDDLMQRRFSRNYSRTSRSRPTTLSLHNLSATTYDTPPPLPTSPPPDLTPFGTPESLTPTESSSSPYEFQSLQMEMETRR